jgi:hypothetical protein
MDNPFDRQQATYNREIVPRLKEARGLVETGQYQEADVIVRAAATFGMTKEHLMAGLGIENVEAMNEWFRNLGSDS